ncbi:hypothetical protein VM1G_11677 [Cytospora mali]|uniref:Uncharacterized protein n=1 Tax=Cytospora mali TaxID=578113 RepID=A0A194W3Z0_CYTMA|nr:hypothetical protein VM1G_11677 [Valsa mali]
MTGEVGVVEEAVVQVDLMLETSQPSCPSGETVERQVTEDMLHAASGSDGKNSEWSNVEMILLS